MNHIHRIAPAAIVLALMIVLAACGQGTATPSEPAPSLPTAPTEKPAESPSEEPSEEPGPSPQPGDVVVHELPMVGRVAVDGAEVRTLPSADAPLLEGERFTDGARVEIVLAGGDLVVVTLGPVVSGGEAWYEVRATDSSEDVYFEFGWVPGDALEREGDLPAGTPIVDVIDGQGEGGSVAVEVPGPGTPLTVRFAAAPPDGTDSCEIDVTLLRTDGLGVNVATETITAARVAQLAANDLSSLFQEEAGTATLEVETDCSFAANVTQPPF